MAAPIASSPPSRAGSERFQALDACRGFCAVAVVLFHLDAGTHFAEVWRGGYVAVVFFFVLSGFVIARAYQGTIGSPADLGRFSLRRFGRLYPLHALVLAIYVLLELTRLAQGAHAFAGKTSLQALAAHLLLVQGFTTDTDSWNFPAWSISVELWTNLAFALAALAFARRLALVAAGVALALAGLVAFQDHLPVLASAAETAVLVNVAQYVLGFFVGVVTFNLYRLARDRGWRSPAALDVAALALTLVMFAIPDRVPALLQPLLFAGVVFVFAFEAGPASRLLKRPAGLALGRVSFSIYLLHSLFTLAAYRGVLALGAALNQTAMVEIDGGQRLVLGGPWVMDAVALACVAAVVACAHLTYRFVEEPGRVFFNRVSAGDGATLAWARARLAARGAPA